MSSTPRFFVPPDAIADGIVTLPTEAAHHARNVLRLRPGERLWIHDGQGTIHDAILLEGGGKIVQAQISSSAAAISEPDLRVTVAQALPKTAEKIEQVLQHGTEVGATGFVVFAAARSVARLDGTDKLEKRLNRWRGIVQGAAEQSGRGVLPTVQYLPTPADVARTFAEYDAVLLLHESATVSLRVALSALPAPLLRLVILVGPEGGFTEQEVERFHTAHALPVSLGPRILRTETAALVALAQLLF
jgi:16S rRNA (uracil1498-N3)-methyltransferase